MSTILKNFQIPLEKRTVKMDLFFSPQLLLHCIYGPFETQTSVRDENASYMAFLSFNILWLSSNNFQSILLGN